MFDMMRTFGYSSMDRRFILIIEAKKEGGNILTLDAFEEMIQLHERLYTDISIPKPAVNLGNGI